MQKNSINIICVYTAINFCSIFNFSRLTPRLKGGSRYQNFLSLPAPFFLKNHPRFYHSFININTTTKHFYTTTKTRCTQIKMYSWDNAQVVLVGNKMDLEEERLITADRGKQLAEQLGTVALPIQIL